MAGEFVRIHRTARMPVGPTRESGRLRAVLDEVADGVRSAAEADLRLLIKRSGLPEPLYNPDLYLGSMFLARPDAWWLRYLNARRPGTWPPGGGRDFYLCRVGGGVTDSVLTSFDFWYRAAVSKTLLATPVMPSRNPSNIPLAPLTSEFHCSLNSLLTSSSSSGKEISDTALDREP